MIARRYGCAAVRLDATRILVLGGFDGTQALATTEARRQMPFQRKQVLDLATMRFEEGPLMRSKRFACSAVALDSRVLVVGGSDGVVNLATTEVLDLASMRFELAAEMDSPRCACATFVVGACVFIVGGSDGAGGCLDSTLVSDVAELQFKAGPKMTQQRTKCSAVQLDERRALVVGGRDPGLQPLASTEIFDLASMVFSEGPPLRCARYDAAVAVFAGKCLVLGGYGGQTGTSAMYRPLNTTDLLTTDAEHVAPPSLPVQSDDAETESDSDDEGTLASAFPSGLRPRDVFGTSAS